MPAVIDFGLSLPGARPHGSRLIGCSAPPSSYFFLLVACLPPCFLPTTSLRPPSYYFSSALPHLAVSLHAGARREKSRLASSLCGVLVILPLISNPEDRTPNFRDCCHSIFGRASYEWKRFGGAMRCCYMSVLSFA